MSSEVKIRGEVTIPADAKEEVIEGIEDYELGEIEALVELINRSENTFVFDFDLHLSNTEMVDFTEWIDDLLVVSETGQLYYWAENFEENTYVLLESDGKETVLQGPFPT